MKKFGICVMMALLALNAEPVFAAGAALDKAVAMAAADSGAELSDICLAVYEATLENPAEADQIFSDVLAQRENWTSGEVYAILRSVLLADPQLEQEYRSYSGASTSDDAAADSQTSSADGDAAELTMFGRLVATLQDASLGDGVATDVMSAMQISTDDLQVANQSTIDGRNTVGTPVPESAAPSLMPPALDIPTPAPSSPQY